MRGCARGSTGNVVVGAIVELTKRGTGTGARSANPCEVAMTGAPENRTGRSEVEMVELQPAPRSRGR
jgi:hypothetical protein